MGNRDLPKWLVILTLLAILPPARLTAGEEPGWDTKAAATYLDARATEWAAFKGADRGQGADRVTCLSCHTSVPYALGRPSLRRVAGADQPTAQEAKMLEQVRRRVASWDRLDSPRFRLSYDFNEQKKVESWGTEAVLNALVLGREDRRQGLAAPSDATKQALDHLWATQKKDGREAGSWDWLDFGLRPWEASEARYFGTTLAAVALAAAPGYLESGDPDARAGRDRMVRYLRDHLDGQNPHNRVFMLWAATGIPELLTPSQRTAIIDEILSRQQTNGGWSLSSLVDCKRQDNTPQDPAPDGYATGLIVHVLQLAGMGRDQPAVARGLAWLRANQQKDGHWITVSLNKKRDPKTHVGKFMSDAATAFAILALEPH